MKKNETTKEKKVKKQSKHKNLLAGNPAWEKGGKSPNPEGRPDSAWTWRDLFVKIADQKKDQLTRKELAADAIWNRMEDGDVKAFEKVADRMEGKPDQNINATVSVADKVKEELQSTK